MSNSGRAFILNLIEEDAVNVSYDEAFEKFWRTFPATDAFGSFARTRALRTDKRTTFANYHKALRKISPEDLQRALEIDIANKSSVRGENPFKYMKGSPRWLADAVYEEIEEIKVNHQELDDIL